MGFTDVGSCLVILPKIKWTLTLSGILVFLGSVISIIYREWVKNRKLFYNEYSEILTQLRDIVDTLERWEHKDPSVYDEAPYSLSTSPIEDLLKSNPKKVEDALIEDWNKVHPSIEQLHDSYIGAERFSRRAFEGRRVKTLKKARWLQHKIENFYTCHFPRRSLYRVKDLFNFNPDEN